MIGPGPLCPPCWEPAAPAGLRTCSNARVPPWDARVPMPPAGRFPNRPQGCLPPARGDWT